MVIAIRHGETDWNAKGPSGRDAEILRGNLDVPLNADGIREVHSAAKKLCRFPLEKVMGTPEFRRVRETRDLLAAACGVPAVDAPQFAPYDPGDLSGHPVATILEVLELLIEVPVLHAPNGGRYADYFQNFADAWRRLYAEYGGDDSRAVVVVLFGNEFRALPAVLYGKPIEKYSQQAVKPGQFLVVH